MPINNNVTTFKHKGFTISELLIALGVVAILTAVLMPIVHNLIPDQNILMAKRAFYTTETVINALINDSNCYPPISTCKGFEDGTSFDKCLGWETGDNANDKFIKLFTDKLDLKGDIVTEGSEKSFETKDGLKWTFKSINFSSGADAVLVIDVNGENKGPNCGQNTTSGSCNDTTRKNGFDRFTMNIEPSGRIILHDCWAVNTVRTDKKIIGKFDTKEECTDPSVNPLSCITRPTSATDPCCSNSHWRDKSPCNTDACASKPTSKDSQCCTDSRWSGKAPCIDEEDNLSNSNDDPCPHEPSNPNDICCKDIRYKNLGICADPCDIEPDSCKSTCCNDSRWANNIICDCCNSAPTSKSDECCNDPRYKNLDICN